MGGVLGDRTRNAIGRFNPHGQYTPYVHWWVGPNSVFYTASDNSNAGFGKPSTATEKMFDYQVHFDLSRVVPTGAVIVPRSWGSLACAYFGQPAA